MTSPHPMLNQSRHLPRRRALLLWPAGPRGAAALLLTLIPWLGGCAGESPATTVAPGHRTAVVTPAENRGGYDPQVIIHADDPERVRQAAIALVSQYGGKLLRAGPDQFLFSKAGGAAGSSAAAAPVYLVRLTLSPAGPGRVRAGRSYARARTLLRAGVRRLQAAVEAAR